MYRWDGNDYEDKRVNFYSKHGARLFADYKPVLEEEQEKQDTVSGGKTFQRNVIHSTFSKLS